MNLSRSRALKPSAFRSAFECQKQLRPVFVLPRTGVHRAAAQANDDGEMLDANGALVFAGAAGGALEISGDRVVFADDVFRRGGAEFVQIAAHAEDDFLRVKLLAGVVCRTMLRAAATLHTGVGLQTHKLRQIVPGYKAEIFISSKGRNVAEASAGKKNSCGTKDQMKVFCMRDDRQED